MARAFKEGEGWICERDCNEVNGARVMPHHPVPTAPLPHTPVDSSHPAAIPLGTVAEDIKKLWHILFKDD